MTGIEAQGAMQSPTTGPVVADLVVNIIVAFGTIAIAVLAIWGDKFRAWFAGPHLTMVPHNLRGSVVPLTNGPLSIFYHLRVVNRRRWTSATNCRVLLTNLWRRGPGGSFQELPLAVPLTFVWAPSEITPPYVTIRGEHIFDFGILRQGDDHFRPVLLSYTNNFQGFVHANEVVRFGLQIISDNFVSPRPQVFEVAWNGGWDDDLDRMALNLQIREVARGAEDPA